MICSRKSSYLEEECTNCEILGTRTQLGNSTSSLSCFCRAYPAQSDSHWARWPQLGNKHQDHKRRKEILRDWTCQSSIFSERCKKSHNIGLYPARPVNWLSAGLPWEAPSGLKVLAGVSVLLGHGQSTQSLV